MAMRFMRAAFLAAFFVWAPWSALAGQKRGPSIWLAPALLAMAGDWLQTIDIARNPEKFSEVNPLLGRDPSVGQVNTLVGLGAATLVGANFLLPRKWARLLDQVVLAVEVMALVSNHRQGIRFNIRI